MTKPLLGYSIERLAPGSYDVLIDGALIDGALVAALVRNVDGSGATREWLLDLLDEVSTTDECPAPFTAQRHTFSTLAAALDWLGIREEGVGGASQLEEKTP